MSLRASNENTQNRTIYFIYIDINSLYKDIRFLNYQIKYCYESHCEHQMKTHLSAKSVEVDQYFMLKLLICIKLMQLNNNINKKR